MKYNYIILVFLSINVGALAGKHYKICKNCVYLKQCPSADLSQNLDLSIPEYVKKLNDSYCGLGAGIKVCCSDFATETIQIQPNTELLPDNCGPIQGDRIYGGVIASLYEFPWMALISYQTDDGHDFQCAGSIINSRYILTAAHCIKTNRNILGVRVGEFDLLNDYDCQGMKDGKPICENNVQDIQINETICHENFKKQPRYENDIGLIRLAAPIDFTRKNAAPICLPTTKTLRTASIANKIATVAGWGLTEKKEKSTVLRKVDIPVHPDDQCLDIYNRFMVPKAPGTQSKQFCAGSYHKDSCKGDSGAALVIEDKYKGVPSSIQYGIVSHGPYTCGSSWPGVYTAVAPYVDWILDKLKP